MATETYTVVYGDYLAKIAQEHGTTVAAIWNHPANAALRAKRGSPDTLYPGDVLHIPITTPLPPPPQEVPPPPLETPPPPALPKGPPIELGPPPKTFSWHNRALARDKAKTANPPQKHVVKRRLPRTDILLVGRLAIKTVERGWLLPKPDDVAVGIEPASQALVQLYKTHYETQFKEIVERRRSVDPASAAELERKLRGSVPQDVAHLSLDREYADPLDPFRHSALVELADQGKLDIVQLPELLVRQRDQSGALRFDVWGARKRMDAAAVSVLSETALKRQQELIAEFYGGGALSVVNRESDYAGHPDPERDVVFISPELVARANKPQQFGNVASIHHEAYGHVLLARRDVVALHVTVTSSSLAIKPNATIARGPLGATYYGLAAENRAPQVEQGGVTMSDVGVLGFVELFAGMDLLAKMTPTRGVSTADVRLTWADRFLGVLEYLARNGDRASVNVTTGVAVVVDGLGPVEVDIPGLVSKGQRTMIDLGEVINGLNNTHLCMLNYARADKHQFLPVMMEGQARKLETKLKGVLAIMPAALARDLRELVRRYAGGRGPPIRMHGDSTVSQPIIADGGDTAAVGDRWMGLIRLWATDKLGTNSLPEGG